MAALEVEQISKQYDGVYAVNGVSFQVNEGEIFGLLGPNGAGKTSTMRMVMNIIAPDAGSIRILGQPLSEALKERIGYLPEERGLYPKMKVLDHLVFLAEMKGMPTAEARKQAHYWLHRVKLEAWAEKKVQELSKGMQQKIQFIGTILHDPQLIIMDEPFSGLDPLNTKFLKDILLELKTNGKTIILSTHLMDQAEKLCESICLINKGKVALAGNLAEIKRRFSHNVVDIAFQGDGSFLKTLPEVVAVNDYGQTLHLTLKEGVDPTVVLQKALKHGLKILRFETVETSLEEIFIEIVGGRHEKN